MKIYEIMLYLIIFNMVLSCLIQLDIFAEQPMQPINTTAHGYGTWEEYGGDVDFSGDFGAIDTLAMAYYGVIRAVPMLILAFLQATILLPWLLSSALNIAPTSQIVLMFTSLVWLVYGIGILQPWMKQSIDQMT